MKFAIRQKDKATHLDMKKNKCNPITLERRVLATYRSHKPSNWTDSFYGPLGSRKAAVPGVVASPLPKTVVVSAGCRDT